MSFVLFLRHLLYAFLLASLLDDPALADFTDGAASSESWESTVEEMLEELSLPGTVALGYKNTVTGEEHYYNGDEYIVAASLYKLPLNMIYAERIARGELGWEDTIDGRTYSYIQSRSLTYSYNAPSEALLGELGGWESFRALCAEYLGEDGEDRSYLSQTNMFTARQLTRCAALLCEEPERFPGVLECLLPATPGQFLEYADVPYEIAQKFGRLPVDGMHYFHASGIVFTDEPIALTVMTVNVGDERSLMEQYVLRMCDYAQSRARLPVPRNESATK